MSLSIIAAMTEERVIGRNNHLPWHIDDDLKRFKQITMGHPVIMGRKTFESVGKILPGRQNIIVTRDPAYKVEGATIAHNLCEALASCEQNTAEEFVIGGATLFKAALPLADKLYLTVIHKQIEGDAFFPVFDLEKDFKVIVETRQQSEQDKGLTFSFITADRKKTLERVG
jgi:dihydrofolate reductase